MKITLFKAIKFDDKEYNELELDLDNLTGDDMIKAANESKTLGDTSNVPELSKTYLAVVAAKAAKIPVDLLFKVSGKDFSQITMEVQNFLLY